MEASELSAEQIKHQIDGYELIRSNPVDPFELERRKRYIAEFQVLLIHYVSANDLHRDCLLSQLSRLRDPNTFDYSINTTKQHSSREHVDQINFLIGQAYQIFVKKESTRAREFSKTDAPTSEH